MQWKFHCGETLVSLKGNFSSTVEKLLELSEAGWNRFADKFLFY